MLQSVVLLRVNLIKLICIIFIIVYHLVYKYHHNIDNYYNMTK